MAQPFVWTGNTGQVGTPQQAQSAREVAALLAQGRQKVAQNGWEGLAQLSNAWAERGWRDQAAQAEEAGIKSAAEALAGITPQSGFSDIAGALSNPWLSQPQSTIAAALLQQNLQSQDPAYQLDLAYKRAQIERMNAEASGGIPGALPANIQEWEYYNNLSPEEQSRYLNMKRSNTPLNIGTGFVTQDQANPGQIIGGPIAIENEQQSFDKAFGASTGAAAGESAVLADSISRKLPGLRSVVDTLTSLADTATYTQSGQVMDSVKRELGLPVGQGAIDRASYIAIVDNQVLPLLRDTFGAAFTQKEGETLRATLGNPNASPAEKKAILDAFITQKERDVLGLQGGAGGVNVDSTPQIIDWTDL
jgi:hypothetical protein